MTFPLMPFNAPLGNLTALSLASTTTSTTSSLTAPSTIRSGDLLVFYDAPTNVSGAATPAAPSGFTLLRSAGSTGWDNTLAISAKIATSADAGATITGANGNNGNAKLLYVMRGNGKVKTFTAKNPVSTITNNDPSTLNVVATGVTTPAVLLCGGSCKTAQTVNWQGYPSTYTTPAFMDVNNSVSRLVTGLSWLGLGGTVYQQNIDLADLISGTCMVGLWLSLT